MADKDAQYYLERARQARESGNERLAQIMENYATNLQAGIYDENASTWSPQRNPNAPTRESLQNMYNQKMAMEQAQPTYGGGYAPPAPRSRQYVVDDPEMAAPMGGQAPVSYAPMGGNVADFKRGEYANAPAQSNSAPSNGGSNGYGIRYVDNQGNATDYVVANQKNYTGNPLQQMSQAYYGGGVQFNPPWGNNNNAVTQEEMDAIGMYNPSATEGQSGQRGQSWKERMYPNLHRRQ